VRPDRHVDVNRLSKRPFGLNAGPAIDIWSITIRAQVHSLKHLGDPRTDFCTGVMTHGTPRLTQHRGVSGDQVQWKSFAPQVVVQAAQQQRAAVHVRAGPDFVSA